MSKLSISGTQVYIESEHHLLPLVEFKELKDTQQDEPKTGKFRVWMHQSPNLLKVQMRANASLTDRSQPKNLIATTHVSIEQLQDIVNFFKKNREAVEPICKNCRHWRDKSWTDKGWGVCDNPENEVAFKAGALASKYIDDMDTMAEIIQGVRYPENFGCRFFEPNTGDHDQTTQT